MKIRKRLFFLHIPKAAGTTFKEVLYKQYPLNQIAWIDGSHHEESVRRLKRLGPDQRNSYRCIMGHLQYGLHTDFEGEFGYVTFLREPVARTVSTYFHILENSPHHVHHRALKSGEVSLEKFVSDRFSDETRNLQVRWISGEPKADHSSLAQAKENIERDFVFAGISEEFDKSVVAFADVVGFEKPLFYSRKNEGVYNQRTLDSRVRKLIEEENALDMELYEWVKAKVDQCDIGSRSDIREKVAAQRAANQRYNQRRARLKNIYYIYEAIIWKRLQRNNPLIVRDI
ncbi:MAG: sulfotransferase family 2 domain-containing protein [Verrucomicrobiota bacterium]